MTSICLLVTHIKLQQKANHEISCGFSYLDIYVKQYFFLVNLFGVECTRFGH